MQKKIEDSYDKIMNDLEIGYDKLIKLITHYKKKKFGDNRFNQSTKDNNDFVFFNFNHVYVQDIINDVRDLKFLSLNIVKNIHNCNNNWKPVLEDDKDINSIETEDVCYLYCIIKSLSELWYYKSHKVLKIIQSGFREIKLGDENKCFKNIIRVRNNLLEHSYYTTKLTNPKENFQPLGILSGRIGTSDYSFRFGKKVQLSKNEQVEDNGTLDNSKGFLKLLSESFESY